MAAFQALFKRKKTPEQVIAQLAADLRELSSHPPESRGLVKVRVWGVAGARRDAGRHCGRPVYPARGAVFRAPVALARA